MVRSLGEDPDDETWHVVGNIATSDPVVTPAVQSSPLPVIPFVTEIENALTATVEE